MNEAPAIRSPQAAERPALRRRGANKPRLRLTGFVVEHSRLNNGIALRRQLAFGRAGQEGRAPLIGVGCGTRLAEKRY